MVDFILKQISCGSTVHRFCVCWDLQYLAQAHGFHGSIIGRPEGGKVDENVSLRVLRRSFTHLLVHCHTRARTQTHAHTAIYT